MSSKAFRKKKRPYFEVDILWGVDWFEEVKMSLEVAGRHSAAAAGIKKESCSMG